MRRVLFLVLVGALAVLTTACGGEDTGGDATTLPAVTTGDEGTTAPTDVPADEGFTPSVPLPADFPVFPGAVMGNDFSAGAGHNYLYDTPGTAEEIVEFFATSFREMGLDVTSEVAVNEEFFVTVALPGSDSGVGIYFLDDGLDDVTPTTPGRGYGVNIDLEAWAAR